MALELVQGPSTADSKALPLTTRRVITQGLYCIVLLAVLQDVESPLNAFYDEDYKINLLCTDKDVNKPPMVLSLIPGLLVTLYFTIRSRFGKTD